METILKRVDEGIILILSICLTVLAYNQFGVGIPFVFYLLFWQVLLVTAFIDYYTQTIVDLILYGLIGVNGLLLIAMKWSFFEALYGFFIGFGIYHLIYLGAKAYYKREAFGFGDVILMGAIGMHLGTWQSLLSSLLSFYIALIVIIIMKLLGKNVESGLQIPFGPYMCISGLIVSLFGDQLIALYITYLM